MGILQHVFDSNVQHRELKLAESYQPTHGGLLPDDAFWHYVEHRFDLAVKSGHLARFEHYHSRRLVKMLKENAEELQRLSTPPPAGLISMLPSPVPQTPVELPVVTSSPVVTLTPPETSQDQSMTVGAPFVPVAVPEPSSVILGGLGLTVALLLSWFKR